jgi:UDP-N-acetylbacillosamine N-acetyltransferase
VTKPIIIFGCGGHGRSVGDILLANKPDARILYVDGGARANEKILAFDVVRDLPVNRSFYGIVGIGDNISRKYIFDTISRNELIKVISVIAKTAHVGRDARINAGCFVGNFCHLGPEVIVGFNSILNNSCVVDHEVTIGRHCHIGPNSTISGRSKIGDLVFVGVGATIIDKISICSHVVIGAGATVVENIDEPGTYIGTPARKLVR